MSNFGGKYFEETIACLIKAKEAENYQMRPAFKVGLREQLINNSADVLPESAGFDWGQFWSKWKYAIGAVPTFAVLTVVAMNAFDQKIVMNQPEQTFQTKLQNESAVQDQNPEQFKSFDSIGIDSGENSVVANFENEKIKTFPGYLAMPSEEVLRNFRKSEDGVNLPVMNSSLTELKVNDPETNLNKINFNPPEFIEPADFNDNSLEISAPAISINVGNVMENQLFENADIAYEQGAGGSPTTQIQQEAEVEDLPVGGMGGENLNSMTDQAMQLDVGNTLLTEQVSVEEIKADLERENALKQLNEQTIPTVDQDISMETLEQESERAVPPQPEAMFNVVEEFNSPALYSPEINLNQQFWFNNNALMNEGRIYYEGKNRQLLDAFVKNEIVARSGVLSGDYYFEGQDLEEGVIKLTLLEFGRKSKIYILKIEPYGLRVITEVSF
jgi:hypothetical protein